MHFSPFTIKKHLMLDCIMCLQEETMRLRISYIIILFYMKRLKYYKCNGYTFTFLTCRIKVYNYCVNVTLTVAINKHSDRIQPTVVDEVFPWGGSYKTSCPLFAFTNLAVGTSIFYVQSVILAFDFIESKNGDICLFLLYICVDIDNFQLLISVFCVL